MAIGNAVQWKNVGLVKQSASGLYKVVRFPLHKGRVVEKNSDENLDKLGVVLVGGLFTGGGGRERCRHCRKRLLHVIRCWLNQGLEKGPCGRESL